MADYVYDRRALKVHPPRCDCKFNTLNPTKTLTPTALPNYHTHIHHTSGPFKKLYIATRISSSKNLFKLRPLTTQTLKTLMFNPHSIKNQFNAFVEKSPSGVLRPSVLPDLTDMSLLSKGLKLFCGWFLENATDENIYFVLETIRLITSPSIPVDREVFEMPRGGHHLVIPSDSGMLRLVTFSAEWPCELKVSHETRNSTADWRDGRSTKLHFHLQNTTSCRKRNRDGIARLAIWNCRGMGASGFRDMLDGILEVHGSEVVILTEIRVPAFICEAVVKGFSIQKFMLLNRWELPEELQLFHFGEESKLWFQDPTSFQYHGKATNYHAAIKGCLIGI